MTELYLMIGQLLSAITKFAIMYGKKVIMRNCAVYMDRQLACYHSYV
jgi:hypothetical protein